MCASMVDIQSATAEIRRGKEKEEMKFAGVPQTTGWISAVSKPKFTILCGHVEVISLRNMFFSDCRCVP